MTGTVEDVRRRWQTLTASLLVVTAACGSSSPGSSDTAAPTTESAVSIAPADAAADQQFPDVIDATATRSGATWTFAVTMSSPYDTPERYADAWRVLGSDGTEYGIRVLTHDHGAEQPFTRSQDGIEIPDGIDVVTIEGRDLHNGWGGTTFLLTLPSF